jgi:predicted nucleic acid-binding protein
MSLVLDASFAVAWLFAGERSRSSRAAVRRVAAEGGLVPSLWRLEVANALRSAVRRGRCDQSYADRSIARLKRLRLTIDPETDDHAWGETRRLALIHNLTLYDAAYLELAIRRRAPLATCDAVLLKAGQGAGLEVLHG